MRSMIRKKPASNTLTLLLSYVTRGWAIFPIYPVDAHGQCTCSRKAPKYPDGCPERDHGKHPRISGGFTNASKVPAQIRKWLKEFPGCNWAVATGSVSGVTVVDVDMGEGKVGGETWQALIDEHENGGDPQTLRQQSGGGGVHFWFQYHASLKSKNDLLGPNVDCKSDGGYGLVEPSNHRLGGTYQWNDAKAALAPVPDWMTEKKETRGRPKKGDERRQKFTLEEVRGMLSKISADNRDLWIKVGLILGREFKQSDEAWDVYVEWADKYQGERKRDHDKTMRTAFYTTSKIDKDKSVTLGTIIHTGIYPEPLVPQSSRSV